jgi:uncharacterized protein (DUF1330 family)
MESHTGRDRSASLSNPAESAAYEEAKPLRRAAADTNAVIVSGFEMPPRPA